MQTKALCGFVYSCLVLFNGQDKKYAVYTTLHSTFFAGAALEYYVGSVKALTPFCHHQPILQILSCCNTSVVCLPGWIHLRCGINSVAKGGLDLCYGKHKGMNIRVTMILLHPNILKETSSDSLFKTYFTYKGMKIIVW